MSAAKAKRGRAKRARESWTQANQRYLVAALGRLRARIEARLAPEVEPAGTPPDPDAIAAEMSSPPALEVVAARFELSAFERDVLLLAAGCELDAEFQARVRAAVGNDEGPTLGFALAALPKSHWSALTPFAPLRRWRLIRLADDARVATGPYSIDERILHVLLGISQTDARLEGYLRPIAPRVAGEDVLPPSLRAVAGRIAELWSRETGGRTPTVLLDGPVAEDRAAVAAAAASAVGVALFALRVADVPTSAAERVWLARRLERETLLDGAGYLLELDDGEGDLGAVRALLRELAAPVVVGARERVRLDEPVLAFSVPRPISAERDALWRAALGTRSARLDGELERVVAQFELGASDIHAIGARYAAWAAKKGRRAVEGRLWDACRTNARPALRDLAQRIDARAAWRDLVLPARQQQVLETITLQVRHRHRVHVLGGFEGKSERGLGIAVLFSGDSGTGKTLAAEVLARELELDLYRIDLSTVVSKFIGETEKNLRRIFDAAEGGGSVLLFDEADALFGKRGEVRDSHDRYANIEVSYLLQRMESFRGLAILTTNKRDAIDAAFLRRLRFVITFPFPDVATRREIWARVFPAETATEGLDFERLARLEVPGGNIRSIALHAAFLAADEDAPVRMGHLLRAASAEYTKLGRSLTAAEIAGWER